MSLPAPITNPDEVVSALTDFVNRLYTLQAQHRANIVAAQGPVDAAQSALDVANVGVTSAQDVANMAEATRDAAVQHAADLVAAETATAQEDQTFIDTANSLIVSLGGTPVTPPAAPGDTTTLRRPS